MPNNPVMAARRTLEEAEKLRRAGRPRRAMPLLQKVLKAFPDYAAALHTLGLCHSDAGDNDKALPVLARAQMLNPDDHSTAIALAGVYVRLGSPAMAERTLSPALKANPGNVGALVTLGEIHRENNDFEQAAEAFSKAVSVEPTLHVARMGLGLCQYELGNWAQAAKSFEHLVGQGYHPVRLVYSLSQLPAHLVSVDLDRLIEKATANASESKSSFDNALMFTRAALAVNKGDVDAAWPLLVEANRAMASRLESLGKREAAMRAAYAKRLAASGEIIRPAKADGSPLSVFIIGPSRAGKTTLERLLASTGGIKCGHEISLVERAVEHTLHSAGLPPSVRIDDVPDMLDDLFLKHYRGLMTARADKARIFTNTHPGRIFDVARLAKTLPNSRFVFITRNRDDLALRMFMTRYATGSAFSYTLAGVHSYIEWYEAMIEGLSARLGDMARVVSYEDMVANPARIAGDIAQWLGAGQVKVAEDMVGDDRGCAEPFLKYLRGEETAASTSQ